MIFYFAHTGGAYGTREDLDLDELEGVLVRELRDELVKEQKKIKVPLPIWTGVMRLLYNIQKLYCTS